MPNPGRGEMPMTAVEKQDRNLVGQIEVTSRARLMSDQSPLRQRVTSVSPHNVREEDREFKHMAYIQDAHM